MKLVKNKVVKLRPVRYKVNDICKRLEQDKHEFENIIVLGRTKKGTIHYKISQNITDQELLFTVRSFQRKMEAVIYGIEDED